MKWIFFTCMFSCLYFISCESEKRMTEDGVPVYKFDMNQEDEVFLQEICDSVQIIPLPEFVKEQGRIRSYRDRYYYYWGKEFIVLNRKGELVNRVNAVGHETGQYDGIEDIVIDPFNERLLVQSHWRGILEYTLDGEYLQTYRPQGSIYRIFPVSKDVFGCVRKNVEKSIYFFSREKGKYVSSVFSVPDLLGSAFEFYGYMKDGVNYRAFHMLNTYYRIESDKIVPAYHFTTGKSPYKLSQIKKPPIKKPNIKGKLSQSTKDEYEYARVEWLYRTFQVTIREARAWGDWILADFTDRRNGVGSNEYFHVLCNTRDHSCRKFDAFADGKKIPLDAFFNENEIVFPQLEVNVEGGVSYQMSIVRLKLK